MKKLKEELGRIHGGRVLDLATRHGEFAFKLRDGLLDYQEIVAADSDPKTVEDAKAKYPDAGIHFVQMDGEHLDAADESFDMVCISNSLHHLEHPEQVLREMLRALKTGGWFVVNEMFSDHQTPAQATHVLLHGLEADMDMLRGEYQTKTGTREEVLRQVQQLGLAEVKAFDDWETDPVWDQKLAAKVAALPGKLEAFREMPQYEELKSRAAQIQELYAQNGIKRCTQLVIMGKKQ